MYRILIFLIFLFNIEIFANTNFTITDSVTWQDNDDTYFCNGVEYSKKNDFIPMYNTEVNIGSAEAAEIYFSEGNKYLSLLYDAQWSVNNTDIAISVSYTKKGNDNYANISFPLLYSYNKIDIKGLKLFTIKVVTFSKNNIFDSGSVVKLKIANSGIYKISYSDIVNYGITNPNSVKLHAVANGQLPLLNSDISCTELKEIPISLQLGSDNVFNEGDYLLFYAAGPHKWIYNEATKIYEHDKHDFSNASYIFLSANNGNSKTIEEISNDGTQNITLREYDYFDFEEKDEENILKSGSEWFEILTSKEVSFTIDNVNTAKPIKLKWKLIIESDLQSVNYKVTTNNVPKSYSVQRISEYTTHLNKDSVYLNSSSLNLKIDFTSSNISSKAYLDYIEVQAKCNLSKSNKQLLFCNAESLNKSLAEYILNTSTQPIVWDVTDYENVKQLKTTSGSGSLSFKAKGDVLRHFAVFSSAEAYSPEFVEKVASQNLHAIDNADMLIIANPQFQKQAEAIASLHADIDGFSTKVVSQNQIFNEFSGGKPDVSAIRNFIRHVYFTSKAGSLPLKYVLLFGDGSYDNRNVTPLDVKIMTFQSKNSLNHSSYVSDDFYGFLEGEEGVNNDGFTGDLDIGLGRFPVNNAEQANIAIEKTINYATNKAYRGAWQNELCFIADDLDGNPPNQTVHTVDADSLTVQIKRNYPFFNFEKIFTDAYKQHTTVAGQRYPDAMNAIKDRLKKGALILNYTGHGSTERFASEDLVNENELSLWNNETKLPLIITASCDISKFDNPAEESLGEKMFLLPKGGAIALLSTTRVVYSSANYALNSTLYKYLFNNDEQGKPIALGEAIRRTKNSSGNNQNDRSFILLGDPALRLAVPELRVIVDSINEKSINEIQDTIHALSFVKITGRIENIAGDKINRNGTLKVKVFDKEKKITTLGNDGFEPLSFYVQNTIIFNGNVNVVDGDFKLSFIVPKDISYVPGTGKFSFYYSDEQKDGAGAINNIIISGVDSLNYIDTLGPEISIYMNDTTFENGGKTNQNPLLLVKVADNSGINVSDFGIGHNAVAILDSDIQFQQTLNEFYESDIDSYQSGSFKYPYTSLEEGLHYIDVKIWDVLNNSSEKRITFNVVNSVQMLLYDLFNYPNPVNEYTNFMFSHNQTDQTLQVQIEIYSTQGHHLKTLDYEFYANTYRSEPLFWDARSGSDNQLSKGIYFYKVILINEVGKRIENSSRLVIFNE
ncbi:MAG: type IX secretion system sortase PorU [Bacteroidales bacterium]|nr:type IX secretion system sortase PorU [Bacteroidales bacterium]